VNKTLNLLSGATRKKKESGEKNKSDGFIYSLHKECPFFVSLYEYVNRKFRLIILRICIIVCICIDWLFYSMSASMIYAIIIDDNKVHDLEMMTNYTSNETTKMPLLVSFFSYLFMLFSFYLIIIIINLSLNIQWI
jgi:hypothetical protein